MIRSPLPRQNLQLRPELLHDGVNVRRAIPPAHQAVRFFEPRASADQDPNIALGLIQELVQRSSLATANAH
jgi:hypothetical protein